MTQTTLEAQPTTCADCPYFQSHQDGTNKGWCKLFDIFARETHQQTQDCINTIADEQAVAQQELDEYIETQAEAIAPEIEPEIDLTLSTFARTLHRDITATTTDSIEVDSDFDSDFGIMYRVWQSYRLLGTFYHAWGDGKWVAQPVGSDFRPRLNTPEQAQLVIIALHHTELLKAA